MSHNWLLVAEGAGGLAALALLWNQAQVFLSWIISVVVVSKRIESDTALVVMSFLQQHGKKIATLGAEQYGASKMWIRPLDTIQRVVYRQLGGMTNVFLYKRRLIWNFGSLNPGGNGFAFVRGSIDWSALLREAIAFEKDLLESRETNTSRFRIKKILGRGMPRKLSEWSQTQEGGKVAERDYKNTPPADTGFMRTNAWELLHWDWDEVGVPQSKRALDDMALSTEMQSVVEMVRFWLDSKGWHEDKGIPWRLSFLWKGPPGTGKTSMCRAIGETFDLPIFSFYLGTLTDSEFTEAWDEMLSNAPCIAFLDDLDRTFNGDKNVVNPEGGLSYATLLQALDGIERASGLLVIATANHPEKLDSAIAGEPCTEGDMPSRPGRIDEYVTFGALDEAGRIKLAARILNGEPADVVESIVSAGYRDTGAQFQLRCIQAARAAWLAKLRAAKRAS